MRFSNVYKPSYAKLSALQKSRILEQMDLEVAETFLKTNKQTKKRKKKKYFGLKSLIHQKRISVSK